jgi:hypothetical protein
VAVEIADHPAAAVEEHETRQHAVHARPVQARLDDAARAGDRQITHRRQRRGGAGGHLHLHAEADAHLFGCQHLDGRRVHGGKLRQMRGHLRVDLAGQRAGEGSVDV